MTRTVFAGALAAVLLGALATGELLAQGQQPTTGGTGGTTGGAATASTFGGGASVLASQASAAGGGFLQGYGGTGTTNTALNQTRSLTQSALGQRTTQQTTGNNLNVRLLAPIRIQMASIVPRSTTPAPAAPQQAKLTRILANRGLGVPIAMWEGDTLVLSGNVANESESRTIEGIALLQPGVRTVRNEMAVGPVAPAVAPPSGQSAN